MTKKRCSGPIKDGAIESEKINEHLQGTPFTNVIKTPVNVYRLALELKYLDDVRMKYYLLSGFRHGFDTSIKHLRYKPFICKNLRSAVLQKETTTCLVQGDLKKGFLVSPFDNMPF